MPVRLGQVGYFRFQKYVEVLYEPVGPASRPANAATPPAPYDPDAALDLDYYPEVEAHLVVGGVDPARVVEESAGTYPDQNFEDSYRAAFLNYEEGRGFRRRLGAQAPRQGGDAPAAGEASASLAAPGASSMLSAGATLVPPRTSPFASATTPVYKIAVKTNGIYRLSQPFLVAAGTGVAPGLAGADPRTFKLLSRGVEVPIRVVGESDGSFDPADYVEFFGEGLIGEPDVVLNVDFCNPPTGLCGFPNIFQANDVTDENIYFLFAEPGVRSRVPDLPGAFNAGITPLATSFTYTARNEPDETFVPLGYDDPYFMKGALRPNNGSVVPDPNQPSCGYTNPHDISALDPNTANFKAPGYPSLTSPHHCPACELNLPGVLSISNPATLRVRWRTSSAIPASPDHLLVAQVGTTIANSSAVCFDNEGLVTHTFTVPQSALVGAGVYLESPGLAADTSVPKREGAFLDFIEVDYQRTLALANKVLAASFTNADRSYQVDGFDTGLAADMVVYDISRKVGTTTIPSPRRVTGGTVTGAGPFTLKFSLLADGSLGPGVPRRFAMAGANGFLTPVRVTEVIDDDLLSTSNRADYIVIGHPTTLDLGPGSPYTTYMSHRAADSGVTVKTVMIDDIYDQFNDGVESPEALRSFLAYAFDNWQSPPPSFVLLVGDASVDPKNNMADPNWANPVPTFVMYQESIVIAYYASDNYVAAFRGADQLPDVHLGRITPRTLAQSNAIFSKMLAYDTSAPQGAWRSRALFLADQGNSCAETGQFETLQNATADTFFVAPFANKKQYIDDPNYGVPASYNCALPAPTPDVPKFRSDIAANLTAGQALVSYVGHGSFGFWGNFLYWDANDIAALPVNNMPSFVVNENCLAGGFHTFATEALAETFMNADGKGAIAVFAPAGLSAGFTAEDINPQLYGDLFSLSKERRFGPLITNIRAAISNSIVDMQSYVLLGDPAQRLILPAPRPPGNFTAVGGSGQVTLSWTPSVDPNTTTRIYRATAHPALPYDLMTPSGVAGTSYVDPNVINGVAYFYRAVSVQPGPFEGGPTNFNSDCDTSNIPASLGNSGPDCRWARPLNPNPPSVPTGFNVFNPGNGDALRAVWNAAPENDLDHYTVHFGTVSGGPYPSHADFFATDLEGLVTGLTPNTPYFMTLTSTNLSGLTSAPTQERGGIPVVFEGINPPAAITDLSLRHSPTFSDAVELSWSAPAFDIYGGPITPATYKIYRDTSPTFIPSSANLIATLTHPTVVYNDRNAWTSPSQFFYLVTTTDTRGFTSGAGRELPLGISSLTVTRTGTGTLLLSWPAVTQDVMGALTLIDHYDLYVDTSPLGRTRIDSLTPAVSNLHTTSVEIADPGGARFLSVIVVDVRGNKSPY